MKLLKTVLCALLTLCMLASCAFAEEDNVVYENLSDILTSVTEDVCPGTAGSSLRATGYAVRLLNWASVCNIAPEGAVSEFNEYVSGLTAEQKDVFTEAFSSVAAVCDDLCTDAAPSIMADAGYSDNDILWCGEIPAAAQAVIDAAAALN